MDGQDKNWPAWRYGPGGQGGVFECEDDVPSGWKDHPSKVGGATGGGTETATESANSTISEEGAAQTTTAKSQTATDPAKAADAGVRADGSTSGNDTVAGTATETPARETRSASKPKTTAAKSSKPKAPKAGELDTDGHPYNPELHASSATKIKSGQWRMKPGVARPAPAEGYPKPTLDL